MEYLLVNARIIGKPKNELFDLGITDSLISSIYPAGVSRNSTKHIDVQGGWVAPAFVDAHVHTTNTGVKISGLDLTNCSDYEEMQFMLSRLENSDSVIIGHGWDDSNWNKKADSGVFAPDSPPIYVSRIDAHSALASTALLNLYPEVQTADGFDHSQPIKREAHGLIREFAYSKLSYDQRLKFQEVAFGAFLSNGICEIHEMAGPRISSFEDAKMFNQLSNELGMLKQLWWGEIFGHATAHSLNATGCGGDLFIDGSFGSKTALLNGQYTDGGRGAQYISLEEATKHIVEGYESNLPTSFHVIGDAAIDIATQAFFDARKTIGVKRFSTLQNRLEHAEFLSQENIGKLTDMNINFSMQPKFASTWAGPEQMYDSRIGVDWKKLNPFLPILKSGGRLLFGSDSPVTDLNPWTTIAAAMNMHNSEFSITQKSAFRSSTKNNGQLAVGDTANIAVWDVKEWSETISDDGRHRWSSDARSFPTEYPNPEVPPKCLMTIVEGNILFDNFGKSLV